METYLIATAIALLLNLIAFIWLVVVGFKRSIGWGIVVFFFSPIAALAFAFLNWFEAKRAFLFYMLTLIAMMASGYMLLNEGMLVRLQQVSAAVQAGEIKSNEFLLYLDPKRKLPGSEAKSDTAGPAADLNGDGIPDVVSDTTAGSGAATTTGTTTTGDAANTTTKDSTGSGDSAVIPDDVILPADVTDNETSQSGTTSNSEVATTETGGDEGKAPALDYPTKDTIVDDPLAIPKKKKARDSVRVELKSVKNYVGRYLIITNNKDKQHRGILVKVTKSSVILERKIYGGSFRYTVANAQIKYIDMLKKEYVEEISAPRKR